MVTVEAVHACLHYASEHAESTTCADLRLVGLSLFAQFARLGLLHALDQVPQKLVGILLPSEFELDDDGCYLLEDGLEMVDKVTGREAFGLSSGAIDLLKLAEDAPLSLLFEPACLRVVM